MAKMKIATKPNAQNSWFYYILLVVKLNGLANLQNSLAIS